MLCPYCNTQKPLWAPVCHACLNQVTVIEHLIYSTIFSIMTIFWFVMFFEILRYIGSS